MKLNLFEAGILVWIQDHVRVPALNGIVSFISHLGDAGIFWIIVTVLLLIFKKTRKIGICCTLSILVTLILVNGCLKPLIARVRPYDLPEMVDRLSILVKAEHDYSFPSGHSSNSLACAVVLFRLDRKRFGIPALILALMIALSRLYVGVHYPTDVIVGIICGTVCAILCSSAPVRRKITRVMKQLSKKNKCKASGRAR